MLYQYVKANEWEVHSENYGATISANQFEVLVLTARANFSVEDSHDTHLNDAHVHGAVNFMYSQVRCQRCVVINIENAGASHEYIPRHEAHHSTSL